MNNLGSNLNMKARRLYRFFKDILGEDKTRSRRCDWHDQDLTKSQRMKR